MINFLKNRKVLIVIVFVVLITILLFYLYNKRKSSGNVVVPIESGESWNGITPGKSTKEDVVAKLGKPISDTGSLLTYRSSSEARNNQIAINNNQVGLVKQMITPKDKITTQTLIQKYGDEAVVLYGPDSSNGINLYIYTDKGFAYLGNPVTGSVIEIWFFPPTSLDNFQTTYAQEYTSSYNSQF